MRWQEKRQKQSNEKERNEEKHNDGSSVVCLTIPMQIVER
jgi:hypothetical protein